MNLRGKSSWGDINQSFKNKKKDVDPRFFVPSKDSDGKVAVIGRFLPAPDGSPIVEKRTHYYEGVAGKVSTWCCYAIGERCPICGASMDANKAGDKALAKKLRATSKYIANFLITKDPMNPENEGKVYLLEFGAKVHKQIKNKIAPDNGLDEAVNVFDYFEGADFKLIGVPATFVNEHTGQKIDYLDYDGSSFQAPSKMTQKDAEAADAQIYELNYWRDSANYKSYDELKTMLDEANGVTINGTPSTPSTPSTTSFAPTTGVNETVQNLAKAETSDTGTDEGNDEWLNALKESVSS
jgi:hypothetical protein